MNPLNEIDTKQTTSSTNDGWKGIVRRAWTLVYNLWSLGMFLCLVLSFYLFFFEPDDQELPWIYLGIAVIGWIIGKCTYVAMIWVATGKSPE
jgi:hypothetical protein